MLNNLSLMNVLSVGRQSQQSVQNILSAKVLLNNSFTAQGDVFVRSNVNFGKKVDKVQKLSADMADYPINQHFCLLLDKDFMTGKHAFNQKYDVNKDPEAFFKWFSDYSLGKTEKKLPRIEIEGPTGCKTIWEASKEKERAPELIPFYLILHDWMFNNVLETSDRMLKPTMKFAIDKLEKDMGVDLTEYRNKDFNHKAYVLKKKLLFKE